MPGPTGAAPTWGLGDVLLGIGLFLVSQLVAGILVATLFGVTDLDADSGDPWLLVIAAPPTWVALIGWPLFVSRRKGFGRLSTDFGLAVRGVDVLLGLVGGVMALGAGASLAFLWSAVAGTEPPSNTDILSGDPTDLVGLIVALVVVAVGTPIAEELFFRGLVLGAARKRWGTALGVVFSSLVFGGFHVQADPVSWLFVGSVTACYGVVFALLRVWCRGRIGAAIVAHMMVNAAAVLVVTFAS
jgi:uncharacterized protein